MRLVKKLKLQILLIIVCSILVLGCDSRLSHNQEHYTYSSMDSSNLYFDFDKMIISITDQLIKIKECSIPQFSRCIMFDSTIIIVPEIEVLNQLEDGYYEGKIDTLDLVYIITKTELNVLGKMIDGYVFYVASPSERMGSEPQLGKIRGMYFYSETLGILFYEHSHEQYGSHDKKVIVSKTFWSTRDCGIFSSKC